MGAHKGQNKVTFTVDVGGGKSKSVACRLWLLDSDDKLVISDIDGTITKSDALGLVLFMQQEIQGDKSAHGKSH